MAALRPLRPFAASLTVLLTSAVLRPAVLTSVLLAGLLVGGVPAPSGWAAGAAGTGKAAETAQGAEPPAWPAGARADYQLGGPTPPAPGVGIVARDRTVAPAPGLFNICYVNAFQSQPGERALWKRRPGLVVRVGGTPLADPGWPDEWILDISAPGKRARLARIVDRWIGGCARAGFAAVEFDNLDSFTRSRGRLSASDATAYSRLLVASAHRHGLLAGQKNRATWDGTGVGFDFAVAESCGRWRECDDYARHYGTRWLAVEYDATGFTRACAAVDGSVSVVLRDRALSPGGPRRWC